LTQVIFAPGIDTRYGVRYAFATVQARAARRRVDGDVLVFRTALTEQINAEEKGVELKATGPGEAWIITVSEQSGDKVSGYYKVPDVESVYFHELTEVDPESLEPDGTPEPEWWAMARSTVNSGSVNVEGDLVLKRTDGKTVNAGRVKGEPGRDGAPGRAGTPGRDGVDGKDGAPGKDAVLLSGDPYKYVIDQSAGRVVRVWDYLNNREQLIYGDTGKRVITHPLVASGNIFLLRQNNTVNLIGEALKINGSGTVNVLGLIPSGFLPRGTVFGSPRVFWSTDTNNAYRITFQGTLAVSSVSSSTQINISETWITNDPWPATLPGVAA